MGIVQDDFTFATSTGVSDEPNHNVPFGTTNDCTAEAWWYKTYALSWCTISAEFQIDLRGSGVVVATSVISFSPCSYVQCILVVVCKSLNTKLYLTAKRLC